MVFTFDFFSRPPVAASTPDVIFLQSVFTTVVRYVRTYGTVHVPLSTYCSCVANRESFDRDDFDV